MNRDEYIQEIVLKVVEELKRINKEQGIDLLELLKNDVSLQILPMDTVQAADEMVPNSDEDMEEIIELQKEIMDRVIVELQKKDHKILLS